MLITFHKLYTFHVLKYDKTTFDKIILFISFIVFEKVLTIIVQESKLKRLIFFLLLSLLCFRIRTWVHMQRCTTCMCYFILIRRILYHCIWIPSKDVICLYANVPIQKKDSLYKIYLVLKSTLELYNYLKVYSVAQ